MLARILVAACVGWMLWVQTVGARQNSARATPPQADMFAEAVKAANELPRLHSLLRASAVKWCSRYFNGARAARGANVKSVSKSIISALVGVAIDLRPGHWPGDADTDAFPELARIATLASSGSRSRISDHAVGTRVDEQPQLWSVGAKPNCGTRWRSRSSPCPAPRWNTVPATRTSCRPSTKVTKTSTWQFAQDALAKPLGFTLARWPQDPQGIYFGGNDMLLAPRQMLAFGELHLQHGRVKGSDPFTKMHQVVPEKWIERSFVPRGTSPISGNQHGYGWWMRDLAGHQAHFAWGFMVNTSSWSQTFDLVVVTTSASTVAEDRRTHRRTLFELVEDLVIAPVATTSAG